MLRLYFPLRVRHMKLIHSCTMIRKLYNVQMYTVPLWHCTIVNGHCIINHTTVLEYCTIPHNTVLYFTKTVLYHTIVTWTTVNSKGQTLKLYSFEDQIFRQLKNKIYNKTRKLTECHSISVMN